MSDEQERDSNLARIDQLLHWCKTGEWPKVAVNSFAVDEDGLAELIRQLRLRTSVVLSTDRLRLIRAELASVAALTARLEEAEKSKENWRRMYREVYCNIWCAGEEEFDAAEAEEGIDHGGTLCECASMNRAVGDIRDVRARLAAAESASEGKDKAIGFLKQRAIEGECSRAKRWGADYKAAVEEQLNAKLALLAASEAKEPTKLPHPELAYKAVMARSEQLRKEPPNAR